MTLMTWVEVSPFGEWLAIGQSEGGLAVWDMERGGVTATLGDARDVGVRVNFARWRPDGGELAVGRADGVVDVYSVASGFTHAARLDASSDGVLRGLAYHPDGERVVTAGQTGEGVRVWSADGESSTVVAKEKGDGRTALLIGPTFLATGWGNGDVSIWVPAGSDDYKHDGIMRGSSRPVLCGALAPSGQLAAFGSETGDGVILHEPGDWPKRGRIDVPRPMAASAVAFSRDGRFLAAACSDGVARFVKLGPLALGPGYPELALLESVRKGGHAEMLVYADWLEERGRASEAAYLRMRAGTDGSPGALKALDEAAVLLSRVWLDALQKPVPENAGRLNASTLGTLKWNKDWSREAILSGVTFSRDGKILITSQFDGTVRFHFEPEVGVRSATLRRLPDGWTFHYRGASEASPCAELWRRALRDG